MSTTVDNSRLLLSGQGDAYDGIIVDSTCLPNTVEEFKTAVQYSLTQWKINGRRGIWLRIPISKAHLIGHAVDAGFAFHHAEPEYIMLTHWLPETENKLPPNASHQVGVGAFVYDKEQHRVLVVQEKHGPLQGKGVWKMPTGLVNVGEDISEAAEREVLEETGVKARFDAVLAMRQAHGFAFGKSDMFFVVALTPDPGQLNLIPQEDELEAAKWMPLEEFASNDFMRSRPLLSKIVTCCVRYAKGELQGLAGRKLASGMSSDRTDLLLFNEAPGGPDAWIGL